jgi:hypothetical protein
MKREEHRPGQYTRSRGAKLTFPTPWNAQLSCSPCRDTVVDSRDDYIQFDLDNCEPFDVASERGELTAPPSPNFGINTDVSLICSKSPSLTCARQNLMPVTALTVAASIELNRVTQPQRDEMSADRRDLLIRSRPQEVRLPDPVA